MSTSARWACVIRLGGCGDNLIASSVFPLLKQKYDRLEVISKAPNHVVFENNPFIDKLTVWPEDEIPTDAVTEQRRLDRRAKEYDAFFNLSHTCEGRLALFESQTDFWRDAAARRRLCAVSYLAFVHDLCDVPHSFAPAFFPTEEEEARAIETRAVIQAKRPGPVIGWCLSGSRIDKVYPYIHLAIARLIADGCSVVMFGAPVQRDPDMAKNVQTFVQKQNGSDAGLHLAISPEKGYDPAAMALLTPEAQATVKAGKELWGLRRALTQVRHCDVLVSPDTGPAWSVAMLDMPKVILLSHASRLNITHGWHRTTALHADQKRVGCWPCHRLQESFDTCVKAPDVDAAACMADIGPDRVVDAVRAGIEHRRS